MNISKSLTLLVLIVHSLVDRSSGVSSRNNNSNSNSNNQSLDNKSTDRHASFLKPRSGSISITKKKRKTSGTSAIATNIVGGFTAAANTNINISRKASSLSSTFRKRDVKMNNRHHRHRHHQSSPLNMAVSSRPKVPNTDPYSLNRHHHIHNSHMKIQQHDNPMAMKEQRGEGGGEQNYVIQNKYRKMNILQHNNNNNHHHHHHKGSGGKLNLSSSISADYLQRRRRPSLRVPVPPIHEYVTSLHQKAKAKVATIDLQDLAICVTYILTMISISLPIILIPMIAADPVSSSHAATSILMNSNNNIASGSNLAGKIVAMSSLGAGLGKVINGFVCQGLGGRLSGSIYLIGLASFSFLLSTTSTMHGYAIAGMEFCASIMWTACNVLIANKYEKNPQKFAAAVTTLSLCSTFGTLLCKLGGSMLLSKYHWREVARVASVASSFGAALILFAVKDVHASTSKTKERSIIWPVGGAAKAQTTQSGLSVNGIVSSISRIFSKRMFWLAAAAHTCSQLGRHCDKILGTFLREVTQLPRPLCGSLTSSITIGLILGLVSGRKMESMDETTKTRFIIRRQFRAFYSALSIALFANRSVVSFLGKNLIAVAITISSCIMAASVSVQFYQFPGKFAQSFGDDKAICLSFTDGFAFFVSSPIWSTVSKIATGGMFGSNGWSVAWLFISAFFAIGGGLTMKTLPVMIKKKD